MPQPSSALKTVQNFSTARWPEEALSFLLDDLVRVVVLLDHLLFSLAPTETQSI